MAEFAEFAEFNRRSGQRPQFARKAQKIGSAELDNFSHLILLVTIREYLICLVSRIRELSPPYQKLGSVGLGNWSASIRAF